MRWVEGVVELVSAGGGGHTRKAATAAPAPIANTEDILVAGCLARRASGMMRGGVEEVLQVGWDRAEWGYSVPVGVANWEEVRSS